MNQTEQELRTLLSHVEARELQTLRGILAHSDPDARCTREGGPTDQWPWHCRDKGGRLLGTGADEREAIVCGIKVLHARTARRAQELSEAVANHVAALDGLRRLA